MEPYTYQPLAQGCIRLVRVLPGSREDPMQCEIFHHKLRSDRTSGPFEALSYVWGQTQQPIMIQIHDKKQEQAQFLEITNNLHAALLQLRDPELSRIMWIDALCINQIDLQERASQVRVMSQIYSHAARVIVWLGQETEDSAVVFDLLSLLAQRSLRPPSDEDRDLDRLCHLKTKSLRVLMRYAWFSRVWVLQEVAAARCVSIACGSSELMGSDFLRGLKVWFRTSSMGGNSPLSISNVHSVLRLMNKEVTSGLTSFTISEVKPPKPPKSVFELVLEFGNEHVFQTPDSIKAYTRWANEAQEAAAISLRLEAGTSLQIAPLVELLERFHTHDATDRRDKVFALLGLGNDMTKYPRLQVDYSKSWVTVFSDLVEAFLGPMVRITTFDGEESAVVRGSGCPLGVLTDSADGKVLFRAPFFHGIRTREVFWTFHLPFSSFDDKIRSGDILCLMQGALFPSLIRRCGDYFLVIKITIPSFPNIIIHETKMRNSYVPERSMAWTEFKPCISRFSRSFLLVWDWSADFEMLTERHNTLITRTSTEDPSTGKYRRSFDIVRILEDLDETAEMTSILSSLPSTPSGTPLPIIKHLDSLRYMCAHWNLYKELKAYISQLRWSRWALQSSDAVDPLVDFWRSEGILNLDLFEICSMVTGYCNPKVVAQIVTERDLWDFGEGAVQPLLNVISPTFAQIASKTTPNRPGHLVRRYITHVVFSQAQKLDLHPRQLLNMLSADPRLLETTKLSLLILAEVKGINLEMTSQILPRLSSADRQMNWEIMSFLLEESFASASSILTILQDAQRYSVRGKDEYFETYRQFLIPQAAVICGVLLETDLCEALLEHWETLPEGTVSVLEFLCDMYTSPFKDLTEIPNDSLAIRYDYPQTRRARADLVQSCLVAAIRAVAPWMHIPNSSEDYNEGYPMHIFAKLQMLWDSKDSSKVLLDLTPGLQSLSPIEEQGTPQEFLT